jgi:hypothetical protein
MAGGFQNSDLLFGDVDEDLNDVKGVRKLPVPDRRRCLCKNHPKINKSLR